MHKLFHTHCMSLSFELGCFHLQHNGTVDALTIPSTLNKTFHSLGIDSVVELKTSHSSPTLMISECLNSTSTFPSALRLNNWLASLRVECTVEKLNALKHLKMMQMNCRTHDWTLAIMKIDRLVINCDDDGDLIDMACNGVDYKFHSAS